MATNRAEVLCLQCLTTEYELKATRLSSVFCSSRISTQRLPFTEIRSRGFEIVLIMSLNKPAHSPRLSTTQSPRMKSIQHSSSNPRLSSSPGSPIKTFNRESADSQLKTSQKQKHQKTHGAFQNFSASMSTTPVSPQRSTSTSPASFESFNRFLQSQTPGEQKTQKANLPEPAGTIPTVDKRFPNSSQVRATVSEPGKPSKKAATRSTKSAPPGLPRYRPSSTAAHSLDNDSISGARPPTSIWSSGKSSHSVHTSDLTFTSFTMTFKRAERLGALARLSMEPLPKVVSALVHNKIPAGAGSSSIGQYVLSSSAKRFLKARK